MNHQWDFARLKLHQSPLFGMTRDSMTIGDKHREGSDNDGGS